MNQEILSKWVKALRSGEYAQGFDKLKKDNCFCVMGVLTDLYVKENSSVATWAKSEIGNWFYRDLETSSVSILPRSVSRWAGLGGFSLLSGITVETDNPLYGKVLKTFGGESGFSLQVTPYQLNDSRKFSFKELAKLLEHSLAEKV